MKYIKFDEFGRHAYEAPAQTVREGKLILGYNKENNEAMLLADGWLKYSGVMPLNKLELVDGVITEKQQPAPSRTFTKFSKLEIRRAFRKLGKERDLDKILSSKYEIMKDWQDAQDIDLNDPAFREALKKNNIDDAMLNQIIVTIRG